MVTKATNKYDFGIHSLDLRTESLILRIQVNAFHGPAQCHGDFDFSCMYTVRSIEEKPIPISRNMPLRVSLLDNGMYLYHINHSQHVGHSLIKSLSQKDVGLPVGWGTRMKHYGEFLNLIYLDHRDKVIPRVSRVPASWSHTHPLTNRHTSVMSRRLSKRLIIHHSCIKNYLFLWHTYGTMTLGSSESDWAERGQC